MRIIVFNPFKFTKLRGISIYASELAQTLKQLGHEVQESVWPAWMKALPRPLEALIFFGFHQLVFPIQAICFGADWIVEPYNAYSLPTAFFRPVLCVYHDFIAFAGRRWYLRPSALYQRLFHKLLPGLKNIEICVVSPATMKEIPHYIKPTQRVTLLPNAVHPLSGGGGPDISQAILLCQDEHARMGFLTLCTISGEGPNKDWLGLLGSLADLDIDIHLVAFGFLETTEQVTVNLIRSGAKLVVQRFGPVSGSTIAQVIRNSRLFIFHSLSEGFGRPVAEALLEQCIVITDEIPAIAMLCPDALKNVVVCNIREGLKEVIPKALKVKFIPFNKLLAVDLELGLHNLGF